MKRRLFGLAAFWLVTGVTLLGADFWEAKSFVMWSDKELEKITSDSPWAQAIDTPVNADAASAGRRVPTLHLTIRWETALPIRQAGARRTAGPGGVIPASIQAALEEAPPMANTAIRRPDKPNLAASGALLEKDGDLLRLRLLFPRTSPILVDEKEIELVSTSGLVEVRKKFKLKEMVFHGRLEM